jgi:hypothetical protein
MIKVTPALAVGPAAAGHDQPGKQRSSGIDARNGRSHGHLTRVAAAEEGQQQGCGREAVRHQSRPKRSGPGMRTRWDRDAGPWSLR